MPKRKSFNPFKMWGSYVGAIFVFLAFGWFRATVSLLGFGGNKELLDELMRMLSSSWQFGYPALIVGLLIGWAIHSLFRRFS